VFYHPTAGIGPDGFPNLLLALGQQWSFQIECDLSNAFKQHPAFPLQKQKAESQILANARKLSAATENLCCFPPLWCNNSDFLFYPNYTTNFVFFTLKFSP